MAVETAHAAARVIFVLADLPPNSQGSTIQSGEPSFCAVNRAERSMTREFGTGYAGRTPRFAYFTRLRRGTAAPTASPHEMATPIPPVADRSIEEGVM